MSNLATIPTNDAIQPRDMSELERLAKHAADSGLFGLSAPQALMVAMRGRDLGLSYAQAFSAFHVIKGKPVLSADGMVAVCLGNRGVCEYFRLVEQTPESVTWETKRVGDQPTRRTFTMAEARTTDLASNPMYKKFPARMLSARCKAWLARDVYPDLLMGLLDEDEARGIETPRDVGVMAARVVDLPTDEEETFARSMDSAADEDALTVIAGQIKASALTEPAKARLRERYDETRKALAKAARINADLNAGADQGAAK